MYMAIFLCFLAGYNYDCCVIYIVSAIVGAMFKDTTNLVGTQGSWEIVLINLKPLQNRLDWFLNIFQA